MISTLINISIILLIVMIISTIIYLIYFIKKTKDKIEEFDKFNSQYILNLVNQELYQLQEENTNLKEEIQEIKTKNNNNDAATKNE